MGGRGAGSLTGGGGGTVLNSKGGLNNLGGAPDKRADIQKSFVDELGFKEVLGTNNIPTATLNSYAIALKQLEKKYGAISASDSPKFVTGNSNNGVLAAVYSNVKNPADQFMAINSNVLGSTKKTLESARRNEASGWSAQTNGRITKQNAYTVTHEYGHMLENALAAKNGKSHAAFEAQAQKEISAIATKKYGASKSSASRYGDSNSAEFFAEAFASANSGNPNAYGKAMNDWLKTNKLK